MRSDPLFVGAVAIGLLGFTLMCIAFILTAVRGGWYRAMPQPFEGDQAFPLQRQLMFAGVILAALSVIIMTILVFVPGGIPRLEESDSRGKPTGTLSPGGDGSTRPHPSAPRG